MPAANPPTGTVTFLFTDIEGSTRLWERSPGAMAGALARHDRLLRTVIEEHGGVVFKIVGDSVCAAFAAAPAAVAAALDAQRALTAEPWGEIGPLRARMAAHAGAVEARDGDYVGPPLNRVARLLAAGHGGQVLLSGAVQELARDALPDGAELRDLGERRLKDLARPERVFQLLHPALPGQFPPLRTLDARPHNLPTQPTPLIGREREVAAVRECLLRDGARLLTLTGPGGTGKTRLGLQAAAELVDDFADGAWFVALAPVADPDLVASTVAQALGVQEEAGRPLAASLRQHLAAKELLLLLDNFEQVLEAAPLVAEVLAAAPGVRVLVTSRARLQVRGEREFPVPPLALPDPARLPPAERLTQYEAVRLFVERALEVRPDFAVTNENAPAVAEVCHRLDGLPLAIELAAARAKVLPPQALLARLEHRLNVLTGGARDLPARQQTLRAAIDWSHDLLPEAERVLFRRLAVFVGGCTLEAAEAVCNPEDDLEVEVLDGLASLVDKSLLRRDAAAAGESRFGMLETIREFALERLADSGEEATIRRVHAGHCLALVEEVAPNTWGSEQARWLERLEAELGNLRAALEWAIDRAETLTALTLGICLEKLWDTRGYLSEGRQWLERASALPMDGIRPGSRAQALSNAGSLAQAQGELEGARALQERALAIIRAVDTEGGRRGTAHVLNRLGIVEYLQGNRERADALQTEALARFRELDDQAAIATTINNLGVTAESRGDFARARGFYEEALALMREAGDTQSIAIYLANIGGIAAVQGDFDRAEALVTESLVLYREIGDRSNIAHSHFVLGSIALDRGEPERAAALLDEGLALARQAGAKPETAWLLLGSGRMALRLGDHQRAAALLEEGLALARETETKDAEASILPVLGDVFLTRGDDARAGVLYREGLTLAARIGQNPAVADGLRRVAGLTGAAGQATRAARLFGAADALRTVMGTSIPPAEREVYEREVDAARAALGEDAFAADWERGRALPLEDAVAEALRATADAQGVIRSVPD